MTFGWINYFNSLVDWIELRNSVSHVHWLSSTIFSCSFVRLSPGAGGTPRIGDIPSSSSVLSFSSPSKLLLSNHETSAKTRPATYFPSKFSQTRIWVSHSCTLDEICQLEFLDNIEYLCTDPRLNALFINFVWLNISHCLPTCTISALFMSPSSSIIQVLSLFVHLSRAMATMVKVDTKTLYESKLI